jgi:signal transduction histidine kinase
VRPALRPVDLLTGLAGAAYGAGAVAIWGDGAAVAAGGVLGGALVTARQHPRATWLVATAVLLGIAPSARQLPFSVYLLVAAHAFSAGRGDGRWAGIAGLAALTGACQLGVALAHGEPVPFYILLATGWGAGRTLREREHVAAQLAARAREFADEQDVHAAMSVRYERTRIASELHDIVAHAITVMVVQANAGQRLAAHDPRRTAQTLEAIAVAARQAEADMRRLVVLLGDEPAIGAAPDLALVEQLVARAADSGLDVTLRLEGEHEQLTALSVQAAYRVVQEGLTNALRYASGAAVSVLVRGEPEVLLVAVETAAAHSEAALAGTGTGTGLLGLHDRVGRCGGTLEAGPTADGGWLLSARLHRRGGARAG